MWPFNFCCSTEKYVIYVAGSNENKDTFMEKVFGIRCTESCFKEYSTHIDGALVFIQICKNEDELESVHRMHMNMAHGVIYLTNSDDKLKATKKSLVVLMNGKTKMECEKNVIYCSVVDDLYEEAKNGVQELVKMIKN